MEPALLSQEQIISLSPAEPLWQRVPVRDDEGQLLGDFMMLIPGLKTFPIEHIKQIIDKLNTLLGLYNEFVMFADLNIKLNILWISHRQRSGIGLELAAAIHTLIPEARLVSQRYE